MSASTTSGTTDALGPDPIPGSELLAALLDGMDAALCAFGADGTITHWNREAERILGWSAEEAVGRPGFAGWAVRSADVGEVQGRLMAAMDAPGRQVHEFALLRKDGGRVLVRMQSAGVRGADGKPAGVYCAFSEVHAQIDLERSIALSEALFEDASWGVVLVDVDLRPTVVNACAARALGGGRTTLLGRPLAELVVQGVEELEGALQHVLAEGQPPAPTELWVTLRTADGDRRRCWRSGFLQLASPLAEEPVPLGVGWLFQDVTAEKLAAQEADRVRFRSNQLYRACRSAAECEDPMEAATSYLDFALAGFADHVLIDVLVGERLVRAAATPADAPGPCLPVAGGGLPLRYAPGHPALQAVDRTGSVRSSAGPGAGAWADERQWPKGSVHALCAVMRSRGRTLGVVTFLRAAHRTAFERPDAAYAESVAVRVAGAVDLAQVLGA
ncbi:MULTISPECIES: PAS domain-containing protein [unclassified Streptomyces]|uniref:PAS domain-containing protein n=1 Tax=unclassified Streptomyces TaxID=2593676 RepID=UPI002DDB2623|nr:PAS domain-containing protein [Streptomyces sp. NBC_01761]WSC54385.1 PAS domain-containing protein [Streptomyces sp. NBC_01761]WSF85224.1 PAS domain-containing protein [Streptomyces sp. NBC_01744]